MGRHKAGKWKEDTRKAEKPSDCSKKSGRTSVIIVRINSIDQSVKTVQMKFTNEKKFLDDSETVGKAEE